MRHHENSIQLSGKKLYPASIMDITKSATSERLEAFSSLVDSSLVVADLLASVMLLLILAAVIVPMVVMIAATIREIAPINAAIIVVESISIN